MFRPGPHYSLDDPIFKNRLRRIIVDNNITLVIETGLNDGRSTVEFCRMTPHVIGIDIDPICVDATRNLLDSLSIVNFDLKCGNSPDVIQQILTEITVLQIKSTLYFLDAHWEGPWPLLDEIDSIPRGKGIIVIHDFKVPDSDFLASEMLMKDGSERLLDYSIVKNSLIAWSPKHRIEYPTKSDFKSCYCGYVIVYP